MQLELRVTAVYLTETGIAQISDIALVRDRIDGTSKLDTTDAAWLRNVGSEERSPRIVSGRITVVLMRTRAKPPPLVSEGRRRPSR